MNYLTAVFEFPEELNRLTYEVIDSLVFKEIGKTAQRTSLQQVLGEIISKCEENRSQMWSTMHKKLDFPKCKDKYISPVLKDDDKTELQLDQAVERIAQNVKQLRNELKNWPIPPGSPRENVSLKNCSKPSKFASRIDFARKNSSNV
jgi:hypothetical protein